MELKELYEILKSTGIPVAYRAFSEDAAPDMPILVYFVLYSNNFSADSVVYKKINHIQIDLYTKNKDTESEDKVENALSSFFWEKDEEYLDDERCYRVTYELEV